MTDLFSRLWKLPSGSIVKVTREMRELLDCGEYAPVHMIGAVYVACADSKAKQLEVRRDWFERFARVI
jgi:hypothetical protein